MTPLREELEKIVGAGGVSERAVRDMWPLGVMEVRAGRAPARVTVARPVGREQVAAILRWASEKHVRVTPMGGATGVCGALAPDEGEVVLDMSAFDKILDLDELNLTCTVESGVNGLTLEKHLNERGLTLGHYPSSLPGTTVGGLVSTRSSGQESSRYGSVEEMVQGLAVILPDGTFLGPRPGPRSAVGPALHQLWLGAEGALGVVLGAVFKVHRLPETVIGRGFAFGAMRAGLEAMRAIMQSGVRPLVMRLYDADDTAFNGYDLPHGACLLVVATAGVSAVAEAEAAAVRRFAGSATDLGEDPWERWRRHRFDLSADRLRTYLEPPRAYLDTIELAAPWTAIPELHRRVKVALAGGGIALCHFSHAYEQGCCAYFTFGGSGDSEDAAREALQDAWNGAMTAALELGATISHHHGTGQARSRWVAAEMGGWMHVWTTIQGSLDPTGIMNPNAVRGER